MSLPPTAMIGAAGETAIVTLSIAPITAQDDVLSGAFSFTYDAAVAMPTSAAVAPLLSDCSTTPNLAIPGVVNLVFSCTTVRTAGGALFDVTFRGVANGVSPLTFTAAPLIPNGCQLNEGVPPCEPQNGQLIVGTPPASPTVTATPSITRTPTITQTPSVTPTGPQTPTGTIAPSGLFVEHTFRADDGTAYQVLQMVPGSSPFEGVRVTTLAGSAAGVGGCSISGNASGQPAAAVVGPLPPGQLLAPFDTVRRTMLLVPNDVSALSFAAAFGGRLTLGSGGGARTVCADPFDCLGQPNPSPLLPLSSSAGGVPAACVAAGLSGGVACDGTNLRDAFAFGLPATGAPPICNAAASVTTQTTICAPQPGDGFSLLTGQAIVFVYDGGLAGLGFSVGAAGFGIDLDGGSTCLPTQVVAALVRSDSNPAPPIATITPTRTPTSAAPPTPTRPGEIPVIATPLSSFGLLLVGALAAALLLAMRGLSRG